MHTYTTTPPLTDEMRTAAESAVSDCAACRGADVDAPLLRLVTSYYGQDVDGAWLDPLEAFDAGLARMREDLPVALCAWRAERDGARTEAECAEFTRRLGLGFLNPMEGNSFRRWVDWAEERMLTAIARPEMKPPHDGVWAPRLLRRGRFTEGGDQFLLETLVARHEGLIDAWLADPDGSLRLHLSGDVGRCIGSLETIHPEWEEVLGSRPTSRGALIIERTPHDPPARVEVAYPVEADEPAVAGRYRRRWPVLAQFFGSWFGQDGAWPDPWMSQLRFLVHERPASRLAVRDALPDLLALDDHELLNALPALGCYVDAPHVRPWLERMLWRIDAWDWTDYFHSFGRATAKAAAPAADGL